MLIYNYGSINIDHIYQVPHLVRPGETLASHTYQKVLGGKGANQSIALARAGAAVRHIGRYYASDAALLEPMRLAGVAMSLVQAVPEPSGHAIIQVDEQGENAIVLYPGANHGFMQEMLLGLLGDAKAGDWLLLQNECSCTADMIWAAAGKGMKVAFNPAPMPTDLAALPIAQVALLFVNEGELLQWLHLPSLPEWDALAGLLWQRYPDTQVVVTLGAAGVVNCYQGEAVYVPAIPVVAIDTTGAGDTLIGYFIQAQLAGLPIGEALARAGAAAALCVQRVGASSSIPLAWEVDVLLAGMEGGRV